MYEQRKKKLIDWIESLENSDVLSQLEAIAIKNCTQKKIRVQQNSSLGLDFDLHPSNLTSKENCCSESEIKYLKKYFTYLQNKNKK